jgi:tRNA 2-thiouridine synthesizing protein A
MRTTISRTLDLRGLTDPLPVARTAVAMAAMDPGELAEVLTTDRSSIRGFLAWSRATGNRLVEQTQDDGVYRLVIRKR